MLTIGLIGIDIDSGNKGVAALGYAAIRLIDEIACEQGRKDIHYVIMNNSLDHFNDGSLDLITGRPTEISTYKYSFKKPKQLLELKNQIKKCDIVIDFTGGDSFSDIYGVKRMVKVSFEKMLTVRQKKKLILAPQTYGPYKHRISRMMAKYILKRAAVVFSRDKKSLETIRRLADIPVKSVTDVAFYLPYKQSDIKSDKIKVGMNVSMLLWNGGYTGTNQFGLKTDYQEYCKSLIESLLKKNKYEIYLIPHVITEKIYCENDCAVCEKLKELFPDVVVAPKFSTPIDAKNYISAMDVFTGARMHSTIAAFSSGVATIPFAYSKKFEGVFGSYSYDYIIDGAKTDTKEAVEKTVQYIENYQKLREKVKKSAEITEVYLEELKTEIGKIFM